VAENAPQEIPQEFLKSSSRIPQEFLKNSSRIPQEFLENGWLRMLLRKKKKKKGVFQKIGVM
jgi:hypothetical protein